jgi:hypothetical protein
LIFLSSRFQKSPSRLQLTTANSNAVHRCPGAGIDFDLKNLREDQIDRIVAYIKGMARDEYKLRWIARFFIECDYVGVRHGGPLHFDFLNAHNLRRRVTQLKERIEAIIKTENAAAGGMSTPATRLIKHARKQSEAQLSKIDYFDRASVERRIDELKNHQEIIRFCEEVNHECE